MKLIYLFFIFAFASIGIFAKPLKIYILAGQSNMQGHASERTLEHLAMDPKTAPLLNKIINPDGTVRIHENIWISSIDTSLETGEKHGRLTVGYGAAGREPKIGPELMFGITMQNYVGEPILLIKTSWGGKSLNTDFRPPTAGPYEFNQKQLENLKKRGKVLREAVADKAKLTGVYYRLMLKHINKVLSDIERVYPTYENEEGYELSGFVWFQGWNDMVDGSTYPDRGKEGSYDSYSKNLEYFIEDVRRDLNSPKMPFVIGVMGAGGPISKYGPSQKRYAGIHGEFRKAMLAPANLKKFKGNVTAVLTENYWDLQLSELVNRNEKVKAKRRELSKNKNLNQNERDKVVADYTAQLFTSHELKILRTGISNAAYHYLGSAKIINQIGESFANALRSME